MQPYRRFSGGAGPPLEGIRDLMARLLYTPFPENGVYICKPSVSTADRRHSFGWGDTIRTMARRSVRMGKAPHGMMFSEPREVSWPRD